MGRDIQKGHLSLYYKDYSTSGSQCSELPIILKPGDIVMVSCTFTNHELTSYLRFRRRIEKETAVPYGPHHPMPHQPMPQRPLPPEKTIMDYMPDSIDAFFSSIDSEGNSFDTVTNILKIQDVHRDDTEFEKVTEFNYSGNIVDLMGNTVIKKRMATLFHLGSTAVEKEAEKNQVKEITGNDNVNGEKR